jgi:alpha-tubulin suppressor-like RCC1 family protein
VPAGLTNVIAIAAGAAHSLALKRDGTVQAWGYDGYGGADVPSGLTDVVALAGGVQFSLALKRDGTVVGWGGDAYGASEIPSGLSNVLAIAAGYPHSLALKRDGAVVGWGYDFYGQTDSPSGLTNVAAISASSYHSLAITLTAATLTNLPPVLQMVELDPYTLDFAWNALSGRSYQLQYKADLLQIDWTNLGRTITATASRATASDFAPSDPNRFYRVVQLP